MAPDEINVTYTMYDRLVYGGAMPVEKELTLDTFEELKAEHFLDRRELGVINVGGPGTVTVDGEKYDLEFKEALYVGCGKKDVKFASKDKANPLPQLRARLQGVRHAAHHERPELQEAGLHDRQLHKGRQDGGVERPRHQPAHREPRADEGSPMPQHTHNRRMEAYFYFNVPEGQAICHQMGRPQEQRLVWLHNEQAITAPEWSVHSAAGTSNYMFIWGMGGENLNYGDMDKVGVTDMR